MQSKYRQWSPYIHSVYLECKYTQWNPNIDTVHMQSKCTECICSVYTSTHTTHTLGKVESKYTQCTHGVHIYTVDIWTPFLHPIGTYRVYSDSKCDFQKHKNRYKGWRRPTGCLKSQFIFCKRATTYRALVRKMTYKDKECVGLGHPVQTYSSSKYTCVLTNMYTYIHS